VNEPHRPAVPGRPFPPRARALTAAVLLVVDLLMVWIFGAYLADGGREIQHRSGLIVMISAAVGAGCLLVVVVLNLTRHGAPRTTRPNRNTVVSVVSVVAFLKLAGVVLAFLLIGVFTELGALEMGIIGVVESLAVVWLLVGTTRHLATLTT